MSARNMRSTATSTSVTRSIVPFLSMRIARPKWASWISPARTTVSMAVVRSSGSAATLRVGVGRLHALGHADFHPALRRALELNVVHEVADEKNAAAAGLEEVLRIERVGEGLRIETLSLIAHANQQAGRFGRRRCLELDEDTLGRVVAIAVLDGVDHRLADRDADPMDRVVVQADTPPHVVAHHLHEIEHLERAGEFEPNNLMAVDGHEYE